jgi:putative membrane protein
MVVSGLWDVWVILWAGSFGEETIGGFFSIECWWKWGCIMMWGYYPDGAGWLMMVFGNILWIALLGILLWAMIRWFERRASAPGSQRSGIPTSEPSALEILRQRYARGEIDAVIFEQMRERLEASGARDEQPRMERPATMS